MVRILSVISIPALAHEDYLRKLVPLLEDGMVIHTFTDNYASLLLRKFMREAGCTKKVIIKKHKFTSSCRFIIYYVKFAGREVNSKF